MNKSNYQDDNDSFQKQQIIMLTLFNKRIVSLDIKINFDIYQKLYQALCCSICLSLTKNPVYLQCSHRFCKECMQKYIRVINKKKSCPNCRNKVSTKRDLHIDQQLSHFIAQLFGDLNDFKLELDQIQKCQFRIISSSNPINLIRRGKRKTQNNYLLDDSSEQKQQSYEINQIIKENQCQKQKSNKLSHQKYPVQSKQHIMKKNPKKSEREQTKQQKILKKKKQKFEEKRQKLNCFQDKKTTQKQILQFTSSKRSKILRSKKRNCNRQIIEINSSQNQLSNIKVTKEEIQQARDILSKQLGENYCLKALYYIPDFCLVSLCLKLDNNLKDYLEEKIQDNFFQINLSFKISDIIEYASSLWDFEVESINAKIIPFRQNQKQTKNRKECQSKSASDRHINFITCDPNLSILEINSFYWRTIQGIVMTNQQQASKLKLIKNKHNLQCSPQIRTIYICSNLTY